MIGTLIFRCTLATLIVLNAAALYVKSSLKRQVRFVSPPFTAPSDWHAATLKHAARSPRDVADSLSKLEAQDLFMHPEVSAGHFMSGSGSRRHCDFEGEGILCDIEFPEHHLVQKWIPKDAVVLELGARFGTTTCKIAKRLDNSGAIIAVEPNPRVLPYLRKNLRTHNCSAHILAGVVASEPAFIDPGGDYGGRTTANAKKTDNEVVPNFYWDDVENKLGRAIDTVLIDCEGCADQMMDQLGPKIQNQLKLIIIETDYVKGSADKDCKENCMDYEKMFAFLRENGFRQVDMVNDCDKDVTHASENAWCGEWINH